MLSRLVEAADKYFIQGVSKSFHSLEDIASISFQKKKERERRKKERKKKKAFPGSDLLKKKKKHTETESK